MTTATQLHHEMKNNTLLLTLDGPKSRNSVSPPIYSALQEHLVRAADDPQVRAIVLYGANDFFCSGGDVNNLKRSSSQPMHEVTGNTDRLNTMIKWMRACPKPIIAAVEGGAAGVGVSLVLACDLIVASLSARFTVAYVRIGLTPDGGVTHFLSA
ncbi:MAG: enoyl-CoA hydratase-related protein, partial [Pseudomonadota bacterium]